MRHHPETRPSLVLRLKNAQDEAAWGEFLMLYEPLILNLMRQNGLQESDARDVCQQVLAAVAKDVEQWKPDDKEASFRRWLFRIARNRAIKFLMRERRRFAAEGGSNAHRKIESLPDDRGSLSAEFERQYREQTLLVAGEQIRAEFQEATWLAFWNTCVAGRSVAEVAAELNTTAGNVYVARSRIIARLREKVCELEGER